MSRLAARFVHGLVGTALLVAGCAGQAPQEAPQNQRLSRQLKSCSSIEAVIDYWESVGIGVSDSFTKRFEAPAKEKVTLRVRLSTDGTVSSVETRGSTSESAEKKALAALEEEAPFPRVPARYATCWSAPGTLRLIVDLELQCYDDEAYADYIWQVSRQVGKEASKSAFTETAGEGDVIFRVRVEEDGALRAVEELNAPSPEASAKGESAIRAASPFPAPPSPLGCYRDDWVRISFTLFSKP